MRPIFLRGLRRLVVRLDAIHVVAACLLFVIAAFLVLAVLSFARAADTGCAAPGEHQVLVWSQTAGQHRCQYVDRQP